MGLEETLTELIKVLEELPDNINNHMTLNIEHQLSSYDNGAFSMPARAVRALESIADSLSRLSK